MVVWLVMVAGTAFIAGDLSKPDFDTDTYDKEVAKFVENENKALIVFNVINSAEQQYLRKEFSKGIVLWEENKAIVKRLKTIENLPIELIKQNEKLLTYCDLRIQHNGIIIKAITEDTDRYVSEIDRIGLKINNILEELK